MDRGLDFHPAGIVGVDDGPKRAMQSEREVRTMLALQTRSEMLRAILDTVETAIVVLDGEGRTVYLNTRASSLLECREGEQIPSWLRDPLAPALERLFATGGADGAQVERCVGREVMVRVRVRALDRACDLIVLELQPTHAAGRRLV